jgi:hypothetical protein
MTAEGQRRVCLRVRKLEHLHGDAVRTTSLAVFCPGECRSLNIDTCRGCPRLSTITEDAIHCAPTSGVRLPEGIRTAAPVGSDACVGEAMGHAALLADASVSAAAFAESLDMPGHSVAIVVDEALRAMGLVEVAVAAGALEDCSIEELARRVSPIHEGAPLAHAIDRMVRERARALPVVDEQGQVVGLLTDLDALHWVARRDLPRAR